MRHRKNAVKLGRTAEHRGAMLASMVCSLIECRRIETTLPKARLARRVAEKMVTLGKAGTLAARRQAIATLRRKEHVARLFSEIVPQYASRKGGYTRILKLRRRTSDGAQMAFLEWVDLAPVQPAPKGKAKSDDKKADEAVGEKKADDKKE